MQATRDPQELRIRAERRSLCAVIAYGCLYEHSCSVYPIVWRDYRLESFTRRQKHLYATTAMHIYSKSLSYFVTISNLL